MKNISDKDIELAKKYYRELIQFNAYFILIMILILFFCMYPIFAYNILFKSELLVFAPIGILTFLSIFYTLIISKNFQDELNNIIKYVIIHLEIDINRRKKELTNGINQDKNYKKLKKQLANIHNNKVRVTSILRNLDMTYSLGVTVIILFLSIITSIIDSFLFQFIGYVFFSLSVAYAGGIVLMYTWVMGMDRKIPRK